MDDILDILPEASRIREIFRNTGATVVKPSILQDAGTLLDLYGEDIRTRAYVTSDPIRGELMLRPDFTVPIVQRHMQEGADPARYTYAGKVFRRQEENPDRASEYIQVGYEIFDGSNLAAADAEIFSLVLQACDGVPVRSVTGDIGILMAAVAGLNTTERRKNALMRHIWRPKRFRTLLERFSGKLSVPPTRAALLAGKGEALTGVPHIGLRSLSEIQERVDALTQDAATAPISQNEIDLISALLSVRERADFALSHLRDLAVDMPSISQKVAQAARRFDALDARGVDVTALQFEASYGRTSMEYYDGFVFGIYAAHMPEIAPIATGGRYDALTERLGQGRSIPAVGAVVRPHLLFEARQGL